MPVGNDCAQEDVQMITSIPASEWDEVPVNERTDFLRARGVPINDDGTWKHNFGGMELKVKEGRATWTYYWIEE